MPACWWHKRKTSEGDDQSKLIKLIDKFSDKSIMQVFVYNNNLFYSLKMQFLTEKRPLYAKIPLKVRQQLVNLVFSEHLSIAKAGRRLSIKPSTAKLIIKKYRQTGTFFIKKGTNELPSETGNQISVDQERSVIREECNHFGSELSGMSGNTQNFTILGGLDANFMGFYYFFPANYQNYFYF